MNSSGKALDDVDGPARQKMPAGEILLLCCSLLSLVVSCILWSAHKQAWMDEIFTWKEVSDRSLWHLYYAIQHGADGGMPIFYTTAWLWAKAFGTGVLTLRLYSCITMCGALLVTWRTIRRFYGMWSTAFGVLTIWGTSAVLLEQNVGARFYGLYMLAVAITVNVYTRLVARPVPTRSLLVLTFLSQVALVWAHVLGLIYSCLILLALILFDAAKGRLRFKLYLVFAAGWLALLVWVPAIRASMAAGKPHGWIEMPTVMSLLAGYLFGNSLQWLKLFKRHSDEVLFQIVGRASELLIFIPLAVVFLLGLRKSLTSGRRALSDPRSALLLVAYLLLSAPVVLFVLSHLITPVFVSRYFLPSSIGMAIVLAASADALGADSRINSRLASRLMWAAIVLFLMISPVLSVMALEPLNLDFHYLDVQRLDRVVPANVAVVAGWQEDFEKIMRYSPNSQSRYYFLLDWPAALAGPREFVLDYHLMHAYRDNGYYSKNIQDSHGFLCSQPDFLVLDAEGHSWFDMTIKGMPQFEWKVLDSFDGPEVQRKLISVHRKASLDFCRQP